MCKLQKRQKVSRIYKDETSFNNFKNSRTWSSTSCNTDIKYRYNKKSKNGEIQIFKEYGQNCQNCSRLCKPIFDTESCDIAMEKIIERVKKVFYGIEPPSDEFAGRHSKAQKRQISHDSERCEACQQGKCPHNETGKYVSLIHDYFKTQKHHHVGPKTRVKWRLSFN